jgi:hypothetical protein
VFLGLPLVGALAAVLWGVFVYRFTSPAARARWGESTGATASVVVVLLTMVLAIVGSLAFFFLLLAIFGGENY